MSVLTNFNVQYSRNLTNLGCMCGMYSMYSPVAMYKQCNAKTRKRTSDEAKYET